MPLFPITTRLLQGMMLPACRRLLFPLLQQKKEIGDVCTQARNGGKNIVLLFRRKAGMSVSGME